MDPDETLRQLLEAAEARDGDRVSELCEALSNWIERGGFPPRTLGTLSLGIDWHLAVTKAVIMLAENHVGVAESYKYPC